MRPVQLQSEGCNGAEVCYLTSGERTSFLGSQDVSFTAWGFGVHGLSATVFLRARADAGGDFVWPRSQDPFDALLAHAQLVRGPWIVRVGRQEVRSGLGFSSFDGAAVTRSFVPGVVGVARGSSMRVDVEAYGGRSLARGLREPVNDALAGVEDFVPDVGVWLLGGALRLRHRSRAVTVRYQRELLSDRSGLASERAALDASGSLLRAQLTGGLDWDLGRDRLGKGHLTASRAIGAGAWTVSATVRRYVPYFSLSTIWGFFEPVAYREAETRLTYSTGARLGVWASGGWRRYGDTGTAVVLRPLQDTGWRGRTGARVLLGDGWSIDGTYQLEWGPGGFLSSLDASARGPLSGRVSGTFSATSFQQIEQYRLGDGRAVGAGASLDVRVTDRVDLTAGGSLLRHRGGGIAGASTAGGEGDTAGSDVWNQTRMWTSIRARLGSEPGRRTRLRR